MTELNQIYKCTVCGNIVEIVHVGAGHLVCCGKQMELKAANTQDASLEKHVPAVEPISGGIRVTVGSIAHPMEEKHYIEWIEIIADRKIIRKRLKPGESPIAEFHIKAGNIIIVRAYCNLHGLWEKKISS